MKIIITGASGFIGSEIVPFLKKENVKVLLIGRYTNTLKAKFPEDEVASYEELEMKGHGYDALIHLAAMNNNQSKKLDDFREANVTFLKAVLNSAQRAGVKTFINTTTLHATHKGTLSNYAQTKREADEFLSRTDGIEIVNLRLAAVYGSKFNGNLAILSKLPTFIQPVAFQCLAMLRPTVNVKLVAMEMLNSAEKGTSLETMISDRQNNNLAYKITKRVLDIGFALFVIIALWWVLFIAWVAVKLTSPGPGFLPNKEWEGKGNSLHATNLGQCLLGQKKGLPTR